MPFCCIMRLHSEHQILKFSDYLPHHARDNHCEHQFKLKREVRKDLAVVCIALEAALAVFAQSCIRSTEAASWIAKGVIFSQHWVKSPNVTCCGRPWSNASSAASSPCHSGVFYLCEVFLKLNGNVFAIYTGCKRCFSFALFVLKSCWHDSNLAPRWIKSYPTSDSATLFPTWWQTRQVLLSTGFEMRWPWYTKLQTNSIIQH